MNKQTKTNWKKEVLSYVIMILISISVFYVLPNALGFKMVNLKGESMAPTYHNNTFMILKDKEPKLNDIIVFVADSSWDDDQGKNYIKRIIAKEDDSLKVMNETLYVNNKKVKDLSNYITSVPNFEITIPKDKFFVMGDNSNHSNDSLFELVKGNEDYLVDKDQIQINGEDVFSFRYFK